MADERDGLIESSLIIGLKELAVLENERIDEERRAREREEARRRAEREAAERRAREEEAARLAAEQERQRREEQMRREEEARLEAMRAAEIERQRVEAEQRARLEAMRREQEHAQQLEMIRQDQSKKKLRLLAFGAGALFLLAAGGGVATYVSLDREAEARQARHDRELKDAEERLKRARDEQAGAAAEIERLTKAAAEAKDQVTRDKVARDLEAAQRKKKAADSAVHQQSEAKPSLPGGHECPPGSLDPLCVSKP